MQDRTALGYVAHQDILCCIELVKVSDNLCIAIKTLPCKVSRKKTRIKKIAFIVAFVFITCKTLGPVEEAEAIEVATLPTSQQRMIGSNIDQNEIVIVSTKPKHTIEDRSEVILAAFKNPPSSNHNSSLPAKKTYGEAEGIYDYVKVMQELGKGISEGTELDRCSRNTLSFLKIQDELFKRSITFVALDLPYSNDLATNKLMATNL